MLFAITQPVALAGLLTAFLLALALRVVAMRLTARALGLAPRHSPVLPHPREDIDPFGAVAALVVGTGWGRAMDIDAMPRWAGRGRKAAVVAAGPLGPLLAGLIALIGFRLAFPDLVLVGGASDVLRGSGAPSLPAQLLVSLAVGLLCFGLLDIVPLPPLDGFSLLRLSMRRITPGGQKAMLWLAEKNLGVLILLIMAFFPLPNSLLHLVIDLLAAPFLWAWG